VRAGQDNNDSNSANDEKEPGNLPKRQRIRSLLIGADCQNPEYVSRTSPKRDV